MCLHGHFKKDRIAGGQGSSESEDPSKRPGPYRLRSCPNPKKKEVITGQPRIWGWHAQCEKAQEVFVEEEYFIEQRPDSRYNVSKPNAERPSVVTDTQAEGIAWVKETNPDATIHVERVRDIGPGRDKWRHL
jgi:hypothetical protein